MSSHYFVKEHQEYTAVVLSIPSNGYWEEYLAWQPYLISESSCLERLEMINVYPDEVWDYEGAQQTGQAISEGAIQKFHTFQNRGEALTKLFEEHPNNALIFFVEDPSNLEDRILKIAPVEKSIEIVSSNARSLKVNHSMKKWLKKGSMIHFEARVLDPEENELDCSKDTWIETKRKEFFNSAVRIQPGSELSSWVSLSWQRRSCPSQKHLFSIPYHSNHLLRTNPIPRSHALHGSREIPVLATSEPPCPSFRSPYRISTDRQKPEKEPDEAHNSAHFL